MDGAFAPLKEICPDRETPELLELSARLGSMMPYRQASRLPCFPDNLVVEPFADPDGPLAHGRVRLGGFNRQELGQHLGSAYRIRVSLVPCHEQETRATAASWRLLR